MKNKSGSILIGAIFLLSSMITIGISLTMTVMATSINTQRAYQDVKAISYAEAGVNKALWEINKTGSIYTGTGAVSDTSLSGGEFRVDIVTNCGTNCKTITSTGYVPSYANQRAKKTIRVKVEDDPNSTSVAFGYGIQVGPLGITMSNNSSVIGNVYGQGTLSGSNGAKVLGDVIMSGASGKIQDIKICTPNVAKTDCDTTKKDRFAKANTITGSDIYGDAYYQSISSTNVRRTSFPGSADLPNISMPVSQTMIDGWESEASAGTVVNGDLTISGTNQTLGPVKINGNLTIINNAQVIVTGTVWVTGDIVFSNGAVVKLDTAYGDSSGIIIADSPTSPSTKGKISVSNNAQICGSISLSDCINNIDPVSNKSYMMLLSTNTGNTIANPAINVSNNAVAVVYYTTVGMLEVSNNAKLRAFTGGGVHLSNGAQVEYKEGLASTEFTNGGPSGGWVITEWQEL